MKKNTSSIELARYFDKKGKKTIVTVTDYLEYVENQDKDSIADFIFNRLHSRYIKPFAYYDKSFKKEYKNGFSILANCCLLIECLQSFKNGWGDSVRKSERAFKQFFSDDKNFTELKSKGQEIYKNVRCGILHQGETCGGWTIDRGNKSLVDGRKIHSVTFIDRLEKSLKDYRDKLKDEKWDSETWDNFRTKMRRIISNCE
jgi:hypothetical protein